MADVDARRVDAVVLALPNGKAADYAKALVDAKPDTVIVDLSADYRFDDAWYYGLPELTRRGYDGQTRISNPGCYATAMQLAIAPLKDQLAAPPACFGVSGYSGMELARLLAGHPRFSLTLATSDRWAGKKLGHALPR